MDFLSALNEKQLEAVLTTEGYLRVIAGAGSGKTKLLVSRYAYLVQEYGIDSANILCVTFTNKAAGEMKRRIRSLIGPEFDTSLICTYHGFCVRVLREDVEKIFYPKEFQIIDNAQQKAILSDIYQKFELKLDHASFEKLLRQIARFKATHRDYVAKLCCTEPCQIMPSLVTTDDRILEEFLQKQKHLYAMDFHDLLYFVLDIFDRCPDVLRKWQERLNYIQVDEFQDSSGTEMQLVERLSEKHRNLMIVGDPDQNIYEWRGSDVRLLVDFDKYHVPTKTVFLNQNYRSTPQILRCANTLIEKNVLRLKKDLFTKRGDGVPVYHYHERSEYAEADRIVAAIRRIRRETGCNYADFAVLYRSGFLSRIIEKRFTESGVPYEIFGGVKFYQRMEIQDLLAYLRLVAFDDDISFQRVVNKPRRRFGRVKLQRLLALQSGGASLFQTLQDNIDDPAFRQSDARKFVNAIHGIRQLRQSISISECVERICAESGYETYIRELGDMERFENLTEFKRIASEYKKNYGEAVSLKEFINQLSLQSEEENDEACDTVKLMTIHAAKGLEFPNVFVIGLSEGVFPSAKAIEERKKLGLEEERRLCYVAITRAEQRLFLLDSEGDTPSGRQKLPSRFLKEIGEANYIRVGTISKELQYQAEQYAAQQFNEPSSQPPKGVGARVTHPAFGEGEILGFGRSRNSYRVKFDKLASERDISVDFFNRQHTLPALPTPSPQAPPEPEPKRQQSKEPEAGSIPEGYERVDEFRLQKEEPPGGGAQTPAPPRQPPELSRYTNLWKREEVPKAGWVCTGVTDLGGPTGVCEMCGRQIIRYVHQMVHPNYRALGVGCICAGKMEGNIEQAQKREQEFKRRQAQAFKNRKWSTSKNADSCAKIKDHLVVLYQNQSIGRWKYSIDHIFCPEAYATREAVTDAVFAALEGIE